jgi:hypothetical protein
MDEDYSGIRDIVEELYPDRAHFLFELLQNAEDAGATEVMFDLRPDGLTFEHDGRPFDERDIWGITNIGKGTKKAQEDKIGRFGVGFKAVFAYSESPHIWSPTFCFKITDLVLPSELPPRAELEGKTQFQFPFNNAKKKPTEAFREVEEGLRSLAETTLLFLSHLQTIHWRIGKEVAGRVFRVRHSEHHVEVIRESGGKLTGNSHFLKFDRPVNGLERQRVAVAFTLDFLPGAQSFDPMRPLREQLRIVPATPGRVAVFFPAVKETSGLRFHLHAPFVPELSRASINETPANLPLFAQLATLTAESLHRIRDLGLLTTEYFEVLPNGRDQVDERYEVIRSAIVEEMNEEPLTPTQSKSHAPAKYLVQGKASLKSLLNDEDLEFLIDYDDEPPRWAAGASQKSSNADRFLEGLAIGTWDVDDFIETLRNKMGGSGSAGPPENITPEDVLSWLRGKAVGWCQELYALLLTDYLMPAGWRREGYAAGLASLQIVRLTDGDYNVASESFFVTDGVEHDEVLQRVDERVYSTGRGKTQKENARALLEEIGVREVGEAELVEAILKRRYTHEAEVPDEKTYRKDLKRFVALAEAQPDKAGLFTGYYIFECADFWRTPDCVFLDQPYADTGLRAFYDALGEESDRVALNDAYQARGIGGKRLAKFALAVGATGCLAIETTSCGGNPDVGRLIWSAPGKWSSYGFNRDYHIPRLDELLERPNAALSQLVWRTLAQQEDDSWTTATYRNNSSWAPRTAPSQLVCVLKDRAWVPQTDGRFVCPAEATRELLPAGFPFDPGWEWLQKIDFGLRQAEQSEEHLERQALAKELGFQDDDALDRARRFAALPAEDQQRILASFEQEPVELPEHESGNARRRAERVAAQAAAAPERRTEERTRSVPVGLEAVKEQARQYLHHQYTNADGQMICQVCKKRLPFALDDGSDYFEAVEFLPSLNKRHKQNYLALCPNHAAMFQHANGSSDELPQLAAEWEGNEMPLVLARLDATIYFTKTHLADLKAIITADRSEAGAEEQGSMPDAATRIPGK